ncbi:hypothetical protein D770_24780 [Flammeovirgaceae bacterium 311]|nr:hypothetical protein D770_24780 [Flammeovirgaceae bacterium 311]
MHKHTLIILGVLFFACSCQDSKRPEEESAELKTKQALQGEWALVTSNETEFDDFLFYPTGFAIQKDSFELFEGYYSDVYDTIKLQELYKFWGTITSYRIRQDSIFIQSLVDDQWEFRWKINDIDADTLVFEEENASESKYYRLKYKLDSLVDFDQIVYSSSGCYGNCQILDVSVDKAGNIIFQGEGYVEPLGFYQGKLSTQETKYIFDKFEKANIVALNNDYSASHTDDQSITTSFIKDGKIVKTIHDYGMTAPKELLWAYVPISNIHHLHQLDTISTEEPYYPKLHYFTFRKEGLILPLEKSESFYLWTELRKSAFTQTTFKPKYKLTFSGNYTYWGPDPNENYKPKGKIKSIQSDGRFYKIEYVKGKTIIYDLGYNFVERNLKPERFRKAEEWER